MSFENRYSALDRTMHRLAFASPAGQRMMADLEDQLYASRLADIEIREPVFVTALPRSGTTLLLETLAALDDFACHTYRNMPFVLCPLLWSGISSRFRRRESKQERAHQDGMLVDADSPESFEEMVWMPFWPSHYTPDGIKPWTGTDPEFFDFMRAHIKKILLLAGPAGGGNRRYLSKNNLNIARLPILASEFEDAHFLVPFRDPLQHSASLLRQHLHFLQMHRQDQFTRRYMAGVGHFDFGENLRPIDFDGWIEQAGHPDSQTLAFWLHYWIAAYGYLADNERITLLCYEELCATPAETFEALGDALAIRDRMKLRQQAARFRVSRRHTVDIEPETQALADRALEIYGRLRARSLTNPSSARE